MKAHYDICADLNLSIRCGSTTHRGRTGGAKNYNVVKRNAMKLFTTFVGAKSLKWSIRIDQSHRDRNLNRNFKTEEEEAVWRSKMKPQAASLHVFQIFSNERSY